MQIFDCIVIGGGPAGITAAIYMARYNRSVLVIDKGKGRWSSHEINENYFGFPDGIPVKELCERGREQAKKFGATFTIDEITNIEKQETYFVLQGKEETYHAKTIIIATGVTDHFPEFKDMEACLGKSLFWCLTCDGHKTIGKKVAVVGNDEDTVSTAFQFLRFTNQIILFTDSDKPLGTQLKEKLTKASIPFYEDKITDITASNGTITAITVENGETVPVDFLFSHHGTDPNSQLAKQLGVQCDEHGYIKSDKEQRTNISFVYAAGDVTQEFAHQVITAAHEGATAAITANYDLYTPEQQGE